MENLFGDSKRVNVGLKKPSDFYESISHKRGELPRIGTFQIRPHKASTHERDLVCIVFGVQKLTHETPHSFCGCVGYFLQTGFSNRFLRCPIVAGLNPLEKVKWETTRISESPKPFLLSGKCLGNLFGTTGPLLTPPSQPLLRGSLTGRG